MLAPAGGTGVCGAARIQSRWIQRCFVDTRKTRAALPVFVVAKKIAFVSDGCGRQSPVLIEVCPTLGNYDDSFVVAAENRMNWVCKVGERRSRVCVVATTPLSIHFFFKPHLVGLAERADVTLVVNPDNDSYIPPLNLPIRTIPANIIRPPAPMSDLRALIQLFRIFRRERFDLVWATAPKAGLLAMVAARLARVSTRVYVFQGEVWASRKGLWRWLLKAMDRVTAHAATHLLAVSKSERQFLEGESVVPKGKVCVLGAGSISGVDLNRYRPDPDQRASMRLALGIPDEAVVALFVGRLVADKGIFDLAEAFRITAGERPNLWLLLVGPDEDNMAGQILDALGGVQSRSRMVGFSTEPEKYMMAADFICLPSHREGFGMVIIEAGAVGIPAIGSRIYGISDAIRDGETGELVEMGNALALSEAISRFADDQILRASLGEAARQHVVANFARDQVVGRYLDYLEACLSGSAEWANDEASF